MKLTKRISLTILTLLVALSVGAANTGKLKGKGHFVLSFTAALDPAAPDDVLKGYPSLRRSMQLYRQWQDKNPLTIGLPGIIPVSLPEGDGKFGKPYPYTPYKYTPIQMANFLKATNANWVAIKCVDGVKVLDQLTTQVIKIFKDQGLNVFGWIVPHIANTNEELAAAQTVLTTLDLDGIIIMPLSDNDPSTTDSSYYFTVANEQEAKMARDGYMKVLKTICDTEGSEKILAYAPEYNIFCFDPDRTDNDYTGLTESQKRQSWINYAFGELADVVMPQMFWGGGKDENSFGKFKKLIKDKWSNDPSSATTGKNTLYDSYLVPIVQAEQHNSIHQKSRLDSVAKILDKKTGTKKDYNVYGITAWLTDEFTIPHDFRAYQLLSKDWPD